MTGGGRRWTGDRACSLVRFDEAGEAVVDDGGRGKND